MFFDSGPNLEGQVAATPVLARGSVFDIYRPTYREGFNDVYKAKGGFSEVYKGGFGEVYQGELLCGTHVVIKMPRVNIKEQSEKTLAVERVCLIVVLGNEQNNHKMFTATQEGVGGMEHPFSL